MLARIAAEYAKGRCLAVVTTDLDAQRAVVWDMGRIASYGSPAALKLFRDVLIASAAVPVVFPPVFIDAEANGRTFREMLVDGGLTAPVFTLPEAFLLSNVRPKRRVPLDIYVLINDEIYPEFEVVPESTVAIAGRAVSAMLKTETRIRDPPNLRVRTEKRAGVQCHLYRCRWASLRRRVRCPLHAPALRIRL